MPEVLTCPGCQRKLQVPETLLGQDVQCPTCGASFRAQADLGFSAAPLAPVQLDQAPAEEPAPPPPQRTYRHPEDHDRVADVRRRRRRDVEPHRGGVILGLGIASLCVLVLGLAGAVIGVVLGPIAWIMGNTDLAAIHAGRMDPDGESQTNTGRMLGMIATIINAVLLVFGLLFCVVYMIFVTAIVNSQGSKGY
jgi:hypothetical protein